MTLMTLLRVSSIRHTPHRNIVVDEGSTDDTTQIRKAYPNIWPLGTIAPYVRRLHELGNIDGMQKLSHETNYGYKAILQGSVIGNPGSASIADGYSQK
jgi:hypothetical protein